MAFDLFDQDCSGTVDPRELKTAMQSLGFDSENRIIIQMMQDLDTDKQGSIDFEEFLDMMTVKHQSEETREEIR